jgi:hypothetical protein
VSHAWPQIADVLPMLVSLARTSAFPDHAAAAYLASKTYYYIGNVPSALEYALLAPGQFDPTQQDQYTEAVVSYALIHPELGFPGVHELITRVLDNLLDNGKVADCLCLAIESQMLPFVRSSLLQSPWLVSDAILVAEKYATDPRYRRLLFQELVEFATEHCDKLVLVRLHLAMNDHVATSQLIVSLKTSQDRLKVLIAAQIAFSLVQSASQSFRSRLMDVLPAELSDIREILTRKSMLRLYVERFLHPCCNRTLVQIVDAMKNAYDPLLPVAQTSIFLCYGLMHAQTGIDEWVRNKPTLETALAGTDAWAVFQRVAALGVVHMGRLEYAVRIFEPLLDRNGRDAARGGALLALGLIHASDIWDSAIVTLLTNALAEAPKPIVAHGAALPLVSLGSCELEHYTLPWGALIRCWGRARRWRSVW